MGDVGRRLAEIWRVLKSGGLYQGRMLSKRDAQFGRRRPVAPDTVPRQHIVEARVREGQRVGIDLTQAPPEAARGRLAASDVEAGGGTVDRLDGKAVLGELQCVSADAATEVEHMLHAARLQHWHQRRHRGVRHQPVGAALRRPPPLVPRLDRRRCHLRLRRVRDCHHKREAQMREAEMVCSGPSAISSRGDRAVTGR